MKKVVLVTGASAGLYRLVCDFHLGGTKSSSGLIP